MNYDDLKGSGRGILRQIIKFLQDCWSPDLRFDPGTYRILTLHVRCQHLAHFVCLLKYKMLPLWFSTTPTSQTF